MLSNFVHEDHTTGLVATCDMCGELGIVGCSTRAARGRAEELNDYARTFFGDGDGRFSRFADLCFKAQLIAASYGTISQNDAQRDE